MIIATCSTDLMENAEIYSSMHNLNDCKADLQLRVLAGLTNSNGWAIAQNLTKFVYLPPDARDDAPVMDGTSAPKIVGPGNGGGQVSPMDPHTVFEGGKI